MKRNLIFVILLIGISHFLTAQHLGFKIIGDAKRVEIPFELYNNLIVVPIKLNNQIPLKFVVDTGVRTSILTEKAYSDILGLEYTKKFHIAGIGDERVIEAYITNDVSFTLPGVQGNGHALLVLNEDYLELRNYLGTNVHGILGYELFSRFIVKIDYDRKIMTLTTPTYFKKKKSYQEIPITVEDTKPYVHGVVSYDGKEGIPVKLLLDTGASHGLFLEESSEAGLYIPEKHIESELGRGLGGKLSGKIARLEAFHLGEYCWQDLLVTFPKLDKLIDSLKYLNKNYVDRNGSIGGELISRMKIIFNFPQEKIYIKKGRRFNSKFKYNLSGIVVKAKGSLLNIFEVVEVRENSVGKEAGFQKGDRIISINGLSTKNMTLSNVNSFLNARENKKLRIDITRNGKRMKKVFRLKSQI